MKGEALEECVAILAKIHSEEANCYPLPDVIRERRRKMRAGVRSNLVKGVRRSTTHEKTMLFMESGIRNRPWYTWYVTSAPSLDPDEQFDIAWKCKKGGKTEEAVFNIRSYKRRSRPAKNAWDAHCCLCGRNDAHPSRLNIKRKSYYLRDNITSEPNPESQKLGWMSTIEWNSETVTAHYYCLYFASSKGMVQSKVHNRETQLHGFSAEDILEQVKKSKKDKCVFCRKPGAASQCANLRCVNRKRDSSSSGAGWYHFPCGLAHGTVQQDGKTWCARCSRGQRTGTAQPGRRQRLIKRLRKERGRGWKMVQNPPKNFTDSSQSSQELFINVKEGDFSSQALGDISDDGSQGCLGSLLQPVSAQEILSEMDQRREERHNNCFLWPNVSQQEQHISNAEQQAPETEHKAPEKEKQAPETENQVPEIGEQEETNVGTGVEAKNPVVEPPILKSEEQAIPKSNPEPDSTSNPPLTSSPELQTPVLFENYEDFLASEHHSAEVQPKNVEELNATSNSIIVVEDDPRDEEVDGVDTSDEDVDTREDEVALLRNQLELKSAELDEEVGFYKRKIELKKREIVLLKKMEEDMKTQLKKKDEDWKSFVKTKEDVWKRKEDEWKRKEGEWQAQQNSQKNQMKKLQDQLAKESKEKKEANGKLAAILKVINPQDSEVKIENREYIEPSDASEDPETENGASEDPSTGVKREAEALEQKGGAEKRPRHT